MGSSELFQRLLRFDLKVPLDWADETTRQKRDCCAGASVALMGEISAVVKL